jgi:5-carboxymethyl-2-hydroxymuconate isomerase
MPYVHLETTADLHENGDVPDILDAIVARLESFETVTGVTLRAYHTLRSVWSVGTGSPQGFVQCTISVLTGRPLEVRQAMVDAVLDVLKESFAYSMEQHEAAISVEVREMDRHTYSSYIG